MTPGRKRPGGGSWPWADESRGESDVAMLHRHRQSSARDRRDRRGGTGLRRRGDLPVKSLIEPGPHRPSRARNDSRLSRPRHLLPGVAGRLRAPRRHHHAVRPHPEPRPGRGWWWDNAGAQGAASASSNPASSAGRVTIGWWPASIRTMRPACKRAANRSCHSGGSIPSRSHKTYAEGTPARWS